MPKVLISCFSSSSTSWTPTTVVARLVCTVRERLRTSILTSLKMRRLVFCVYTHKWPYQLLFFLERLTHAYIHYTIPKFIHFCSQQDLNPQHLAEGYQSVTLWWTPDTVRPVALYIYYICYYYLLGTTYYFKLKIMGFGPKNI